jgi:hypothetical protein
MTNGIIFLINTVPGTAQKYRYSINSQGHRLAFTEVLYFYE